MRSAETNLLNIAKSLEPYYKGVSEYNEKAVSKFLDGSGEMLKSLIALLENLDTWNEEELDDLLKNSKKAQGYQLQKLISL